MGSTSRLLCRTVESRAISVFNVLCVGQLRVVYCLYKSAVRFYRLNYFRNCGMLVKSTIWSTLCPLNVETTATFHSNMRASLWVVSFLRLRSYLPHQTALGANAITLKPWRCILAFKKHLCLYLPFNRGSS